MRRCRKADGRHREVRREEGKRLKTTNTPTCHANAEQGHVRAEQCSYAGCTDVHAAVRAPSTPSCCTHERREIHHTGHDWQPQLRKNGFSFNAHAAPRANGHHAGVTVSSVEGGPPRQPSRARHRPSRHLFAQSLQPGGGSWPPNWRGKSTVIINVFLDVTNLSANLRCSHHVSCKRLGIPMVGALNLYDEFEKTAATSTTAPPAV